MSEHYKQASFRKLLDRLQEQSWELELIISGFAIYGLFMAYDPVSIMTQQAQNEQQVYRFVIGLVAQISCAILIFNLILHVILRGIWIGALGLRYVSGDIEYDKLNYSKKFTRYLEKKVGSFDKYIATLENYCSIIFAVSFLLIFYVLAFIFTIICIAVIAIYVIDSDVLPGKFAKPIGIFLEIFILIGMFLTLIDFVFQGILKKKQWVSKIYFPVYWVFGFVTLSFLYRPLVYNFLDNKFGKRLSFGLIPAYIVILLVTSLEYRTSNYLSPQSASNDIYASSNNYDDQMKDEGDFVKVASIPSKVIRDPFLKIFIVFKENIENQVFAYNPSLRPEEDQRGLTSNLNFDTDDDWDVPINNDSISREYLKAFNEIYYIKIDSTKYPADFILSENKNNRLGFESYVSIEELSRGKHTLHINRLRVRDEDTVYLRVAEIPFWYFNASH